MRIGERNRVQCRGKIDVTHVVHSANPISLRRRGCRKASLGRLRILLSVALPSRGCTLIFLLLETNEERGGAPTTLHNEPLNRFPNAQVSNLATHALARSATPYNLDVLIDW